MLKNFRDVTVGSCKKCAFQEVEATLLVPYANKICPFVSCSFGYDRMEVYVRVKKVVLLAEWYSS